ncbi:AAA family ATPase [Microbacterium sp. NPDC055521]
MNITAHPISRADAESDLAKILAGITSVDPLQVEAAGNAIARRVPAEYVDARTAWKRTRDAAPVAQPDEVRDMKKAFKRGYRKGAYQRQTAPLTPVSKLADAADYEERKNRKREDRQMVRELVDEENDRPPISEGMLDFAGLVDGPPLRPLVAGVLDLDTVALLYAPPATFKTFLALWIAACVALGKPWAGRSVEQGSVLYVLTEGVAGARKRAAALAWLLNKGRPIPDFFVYPAPVNLMSDADVAELAAFVRDRGIRLVVLDTLVKVAGGAEENNNTEMTRVTSAAEQIKRAGDGETTVMLVHHAGKNGDLRGASALLGNFDTVLRLDGDAGMLTLSADKQKDAAPGEILRLRARPVAEFDTLVLEALAPGQGQPSGAQAARVEESLAHFVRAFSETGSTVTQFVDLLVEAGTAKKTAAHEYVNELVKTGRLKKITAGRGSRLELAPERATFALPNDTDKKHDTKEK